jgi:hypothetical protein
MANKHVAEKAEILHNFLIMLETTKTNNTKNNDYDYGEMILIRVTLKILLIINFTIYGNLWYFSNFGLYFPLLKHIK